MVHNDAEVFGFASALLEPALFYVACNAWGLAWAGSRHTAMHAVLRRARC